MIPSLIIILLLSHYIPSRAQSKINLAQALINYKIELLNLKIQTLYDFEKGEPILPSELYLKEDNNTENK